MNKEDRVTANSTALLLFGYFYFFFFNYKISHESTWDSLSSNLISIKFVSISMMIERLSTQINNLQSKSVIGFCKYFNMNDNYAGTTMLMHNIMSMSTVQLFDLTIFFLIFRL